MDDWSRQFARVRSRLGISQAELAALSHVSHASIKAYEEGKRHPSRPYLAALLDALKLDRAERNSIMTAAGYASDGLSLRATNEDVTFTIEEAAREIERYAWPAFIVNEMMGVPCANRVAQTLWGVDLDREFLDPNERNLFSVVSNPRIATRCVNLDEVLLVVVAVWKGHHRGAETLDAPSPLFGAMLEQFLNGDPAVVGRFAAAWQTGAPRTPKLRWDYPVVWDEPGIGVMRFHCFASAASEVDGLSFNDWIPLDAVTWERLERVRRRMP
jgi:transcriptional regulator with XRE-family HTH domain